MDVSRTRETPPQTLAAVLKLMLLQYRPAFVLCGVLLTVGCVFSMAFAQSSGSGPEPVIIQRTMVRLTQPDGYRLPVQLEPGQKVTLTAAFDGVIRVVGAEPGKKFDFQGELATFDSRRVALLLTRAQAAKRLAETELSQAKVANNAQQIALAEARLDLANAEINLAEFDQQATSVRAPYPCVVLDVHVQVGQRVRAGDPIATVGDPGTLTCRVPIDRKGVEKGQLIRLTVEDATASGEIVAVLPLSEEQQKFRDLAVSVAMAEVTFNNRSGNLQIGQAVFPQLLPEDPVARVPLTSLKSGQSGDRVVQVLRNHVVRNIPVRLHGQIGKEDVFVSGPFTEHDEVIISSSVELTDSTAVEPSTPERFGSPGGSSAGTSSTGTPKTNGRRKADAAGF